VTAPESIAAPEARDDLDEPATAPGAETTAAYPLAPETAPEAAPETAKAKAPNHAEPQWGKHVEESALFSLFLKEYPLLRAFRHGVMLVMPLLLAAALALLVNNFPLQAYQDFMTASLGPDWKEPGLILYDGTIEILALIVAFTFSDCLISLHNERHPENPVLGALGAVTAFSCLFIMMGPTMSSAGIILPWAGLRGLFGSLVITFCACTLLLFLSGIKRLRSPLFSEGADPLLPIMFSSLLPVLLTLFAFVALREALNFFGVENLHQAFYNAVRAPFLQAQDSFGLGAAYAFLVQVFWFLGIHGADMLDPITHHVLTRAIEGNSLAVNSHLPPPHILTKYLFDVYIHMGGAGTTLGLIAAIFLRSKDPGARRIAAISVLPGIFNINEVLIFGLPIVLNPAFLLPFLFTPLILLLISYLAIVTGIAPLPVYQVDWTTPPIISGYLSTNSWSGVALQVVNLTIAVLLYLPFVGLADRAKIADRRKSFADLARMSRNSTRGPTGKRCTDRPGNAGTLARGLANDMHVSLENKDGCIQLHYQPRVDVVNKSVPAVEALLRWHHPIYGLIPASLTLAIAEDAGLSRRLANEVALMAFEQQYQWRAENIITTIGINISEEQLSDPLFPLLLQELFDLYGLPRDAMIFEIREELALDPNGRHLAAIEALHGVGANIAVDDFGKSYQAISHVKRLPLSELQIDRALVRDVATNRLSQDVVGTIQELCFRLGIKTSAEHVENREQLEALLELNCGVFQGYYFSRPVTAAECTEFLKSYPKEAPPGDAS
jgi:lactose/cellobiose-specific phosphotransferase system IIC component